MLGIESATIKGAGLMQCGPWSLNLMDVHKKGVTAEELVEKSMKKLNYNAEHGLIDDPKHLQWRAIYLVGGTKDHTVPLVAEEAIYE